MSSTGPSRQRPRRRPEAASEPETPRGLVWVNDRGPGIRRIRDGEGFAYRSVDGRRLRNAAELQRIAKLAIPPAYEDVWICPLANGHLQATGRDARQRKQYRYHPKWRLARDADKFDHMLAFGAALPRIRRQIKAELAAPVGSTPGRGSVLAAIVRLLDTTLVRVGNEEYARENKSFGLTTLRNRHVAVSGSTLRLRFRGKSGVEHRLSIEDPRVAKIVRRCQAMPGQELFQYEDEAGAPHVVDSADVNDYIRTAAGGDFTAKDFRTWHASVHALDLWAAQCAAEASQRRTPNQLLADVAAKLGNTVAVCRKSYVHPRVLETLATVREADELAALVGAHKRPGLDAAERRLLAFLAAI